MFLQNIGSELPNPSDVVGGILTMYSVCVCARVRVCRLTDARLQANLIRRRRRHLSGSLNKSAFSRDFSNIALLHIQKDDSQLSPPAGGNANWHQRHLVLGGNFFARRSENLPAAPSQVYFAP